MPSLTIFGRRWLSGSDDFFFTGLFFGAWNLICTCLAWIPYLDGSCNHALALPLGVACLCGAVFFFFLSVFTCRGRILEPSSRTMVSPLLYLGVAQNIALIIVGIYSIVDFFKGNFPATCSGKQQLSLKFSAIVSVILPFLFFTVTLLVSYDSYGGIPEMELRQNADLYHETWVKKIKKAFCCFSYDENSEYFDHIAGVLAYLFQGHDIVPTDILAGMALLGSHQRRVMRERSQSQVRINFAKNRDTTPFKVSHQAIQLHKLTDEDRRIVDDIAHFAKYFMAAYGWALFVYKDLKCGLCKLCSHDVCCCCGCCRDHHGVHIGDNCCFCNNTAMLATTQVNEEDVILTSFANEVMRPAFYVVIDRPTNTMVIVVRGTMSLQDTLVDLVATPAKINISDLQQAKQQQQSGTAVDAAAASSSIAAAGGGDDAASIPSLDANSCLVHGGILKSSTTIFETLQGHSIFKSLVDENGAHKDKKVKVIGHSLGAGCATVVSLLMRERFPELKPRLTCYAVSPPGGLLSKDLSEYTKSFVISPFVGMDVVPRLALHTITNVRDALFECLSAAEHNKNVVLFNTACPLPCGNNSLLPDPEEVPELSPEASQRVALLLSGHHPPERMAATRDEKIVTRSQSKGNLKDAKNKGGGRPLSPSLSSSSMSLPPQPSSSPSASPPNQNSKVNDASSTDQLLPPHARQQPDDAKQVVLHTPGTTPKSGQEKADGETSPSGKKTVEHEPMNLNFESDRKKSKPTPPSAAASSIVHNNDNNNTTTTTSGEAGGGESRIDIPREGSHSTFAAQLYPPGRLLQYVNVGSSDQACGYCCGMSGLDAMCSKKVYLPTWVTADDLQELICCPSMMLDHFPDRVQNIFEGARDAVRSGDFDGCFDENLTAEKASEERRRFKPTCYAAPSNSPLRAQSSSAQYGTTSSM